jgi:uncharacterized membrane protein
VRGLRVVAPAFLAAGVAAVAYAVAAGGAQVGLFLVFPVVFGDSWLFYGGVLLLLVGLFALPLSFAGDAEVVPLPTPGASTAGGSGGLVLIGPVPIFFGSWRAVSRRTRIAVAAAGMAILVAAVLAALYLLR